MLPHATACESGHNSVLRARRTCTFDAAPQSISRGRRMVSACAAHAPMHPHCADMPAAVTAEPHAPKNIIGGRWAHARGLGGMLLLSSLPMLLSPKTGVPALLERVDGLRPLLDGYMAACAPHVPVQTPSRGVVARRRARYTQPPSP